MAHGLAFALVQTGLTQKMLLGISNRSMKNKCKKLNVKNWNSRAHGCVHQSQTKELLCHWTGGLRQALNDHVTNLCSFSPVASPKFFSIIAEQWNGKTIATQFNPHNEILVVIAPEGFCCQKFWLWSLGKNSLIVPACCQVRWHWRCVAKD